jgi:hypothetical protein
MAHGKSLRQIKAEKKQASKEMHRANKEKKKAAREAQFPNGINPAGIRPRLIDVRDIVDWLRSQDDAPYPLATNAKVMRMWFEVMDAGVSMRNLDRRLAEVLDLWRTEGDPENSYTVEQQQNALAKDGPDMTPPVVTVTWQQFQQQKRLAQADPSAARPSTTDPSALDHSTADTAPPFAHGGHGASTVSSFVPDGVAVPFSLPFGHPPAPCESLPEPRRVNLRGWRNGDFRCCRAPSSTLESIRPLGLPRHAVIQPQRSGDVSALPWLRGSCPEMVSLAESPSN